MKQRKIDDFEQAKDAFRLAVHLKAVEKSTGGNDIGEDDDHVHDAEPSRHFALGFC